MRNFTGGGIPRRWKKL